MGDPELPAQVVVSAFAQTKMGYIAPCLSRTLVSGSWLVYCLSSPISRWDQCLTARRPFSPLCQKTSAPLLERTLLLQPLCLPRSTSHTPLLLNRTSRQEASADKPPDWGQPNPYNPVSLVQTSSEQHTHSDFHAS
jgi:hypothetical protein